MEFHFGMPTTTDVSARKNMGHILGLNLSKVKIIFPIIALGFLLVCCTQNNKEPFTTLSGVPAQWFQIYAKGRGQEAIMDHYVLVYNMKGYVISHFTLADRYDSDKVEADRIIQSFHLLTDK